MRNVWRTVWRICKLMVKQILLVSDLGNVWRTVWRISILMLGCKKVRHSIEGKIQLNGKGHCNDQVAVFVNVLSICPFQHILKLRDKITFFVIVIVVNVWFPDAVFRSIFSRRHPCFFYMKLFQWRESSWSCFYFCNMFMPDIAWMSVKPFLKTCSFHVFSPRSWKTRHYHRVC